MGNKSAVAAKRSIGGIAFTGGAAIFLLVVGFALILEVPFTIYRQEAAWQWPSAQGQILSVSRSVRAGTAVRYDYYIAGRRYEDSTGNLPHINRTNLRVGNKVTVRYKPNDPRISVFRPRLSSRQRGSPQETTCLVTRHLGTGTMAKSW
jgi:Protein of unknown function (DUF3592)